jgi:hypothetical protein
MAEPHGLRLPRRTRIAAGDELRPAPRSRRAVTCAVSTSWPYLCRPPLCEHLRKSAMLRACSVVPLALASLSLAAPAQSVPITTYPGVYVRETAGSVQPIAGVNTGNGGVKPHLGAAHKFTAVPLRWGVVAGDPKFLNWRNNAGATSQASRGIVSQPTFHGSGAVVRR